MCVVIALRSKISSASGNSLTMHTIHAIHATIRSL